MVGSLRIARQAPLSATASLEIGDQPPSAVWADLAHARGIKVGLVDALATLRKSCECISDVYESLEGADVSALGGAYADFVVNVVAGGGKERQALPMLLDATADFGQPNDQRQVVGIGLDASLSAVVNGPLALLGLTPKSMEISVRMTPAFEQRRHEHRRTICELLSNLAEVSAVTIVTDHATERYLREHHSNDLTGVSRSHSDSPSGTETETIAERALVVLKPDGRAVSILRTIATDPAEECSYDELVASENVTRSRIRQVMNHGGNSLAALNLVETYRGIEGTTVSLLPAGRRVVERLDAKIGRQSRLDSLPSADTTTSSGTPPNPANHGRVTPTRGIGKEGRSVRKSINDLESVAPPVASKPECEPTQPDSTPPLD